MASILITPFVGSDPVSEQIRLELGSASVKAACSEDEYRQALETYFAPIADARALARSVATGQTWVARVEGRPGQAPAFRYGRVEWEGEGTTNV